MEKIRMTVRLVPELEKKLNEMSQETGQSKNSLIVSACWEFVMAFKEKGGKDND